MLEATAGLIKPPAAGSRLRPGRRGRPGPDLAGLASRRRRAARSSCGSSFKADEREYVYFLETRGRGIFLRAAPIDVSKILRDVLFDRMKATVLTSATLTVEGTFDYIRSRLGLESPGATRS